MWGLHYIIEDFLKGIQAYFNALKICHFCPFCLSKVPRNLLSTSCKFFIEPTLSSVPDRRSLLCNEMALEAVELLSEANHTDFAFEWSMLCQDCTECWTQTGQKPGASSIYWAQNIILTCIDFMLYNEGKQLDILNVYFTDKNSEGTWIQTHDLPTQPFFIIDIPPWQA